MSRSVEGNSQASRHYSVAKLSLDQLLDVTALFCCAPIKINGCPSVDGSVASQVADSTAYVLRLNVHRVRCEYTTMRGQ